MISIRNILVPLDLSEYAAHALPYARELATTFGATLHLLHVVDTQHTARDRPRPGAAQMSASGSGLDPHCGQSPETPLPAVVARQNRDTPPRRRCAGSEAQQPVPARARARRPLRRGASRPGPATGGESQRQQTVRSAWSGFHRDVIPLGRARILGPVAGGVTTAAGDRIAVPTLVGPHVGGHETHGETAAAPVAEIGL